MTLVGPFDKGAFTVAAIAWLSIAIGFPVYTAHSVAALAASALGTTALLLGATLVAVITYFACALAFRGCKIYMAEGRTRTNAHDGQSGKHGAKPKRSAGSSRIADGASGWAVFLAAGAIVFAAWLPCYLAYFPGVLSYDMEYQSAMALAWSFSSFHPPLHTAFWAACLSIGQACGIEPVVLYSLFQMLLLAAAAARLVSWLHTAGFGWQRIAALAFFALNPVIALFSFIPTKDCFFAAFFLLLLVELFDFVAHPEAFCASRGKLAVTLLLALLCCLTRNNMVYVCVVALPFSLIAPTGWRRWLAGGIAATCIAAALVMGPVYSFIGIQPGMAREGLSVPIQQVALVMTRHADELSASDMEAIDESLIADEVAEKYNPRYADPVKDLYRNDSSTTRFLATWTHLGMRYPLDYLDAFLDLNVPSWYPLASAIDPYAERDYIETYVRESDFYTFERHSKLPLLYDLYEHVADFSLFESNPLSAPFALSTPFVLLVFCLGASISLRSRASLAVCGCMLLYWASFLLGPVTALRYLFPLIFALPLALVVALFRPQFDMKKKWRAASGKRL